MPSHGLEIGDTERKKSMPLPEGAHNLMGIEGRWGHNNFFWSKWCSSKMPCPTLWGGFFIMLSSGRMYL